VTNTQSVVLVTGAASGIGRACAIHLAQQGYHVFGTARREADRVTNDLRKNLSTSHRLEVLTVDVGDDLSVRRAVEHVVAQAGRLDGVVNCAGFGIAGAVEQTSDQEALAILDTNLLGVVRVCRAALPILRKQRSGTIINISSIGGRMGLPFQGFYSATKFALEGLTEALRMEVRGFGVRAVLIEPGDFCTGFTDRRRIVEGAQASDVYRASQGHVLAIVEKEERGGASPEVIARLVSRILSKHSPRVRYTVGAMAQRLAAGLKNVLPSKWFEWVLTTYYGVK
jgi:NAD(P)-dependent dehydrogenase (short-subunit alcohol dehydrogenase family)